MGLKAIVRRVAPSGRRDQVVQFPEKFPENKAGKASRPKKQPP